jgi:hypothetical protein
MEAACFLGCGGFFLLHFYLSHKNHDMENSEESIPVGLAIMMLIADSLHNDCHAIHQEL